MGEKIIYFRAVTEEDSKDLFRWRNDPLTRQSSFNTNEVSWKEHVRWFRDSLANPLRNIFVILNDVHEKIGQARFDRTGDSAEIDINLAPEHRGKGYERVSIERGCARYFNNFPVTRIIAKIKKPNAASLRAFQNAGFSKYKECRGHVQLRLRKKMKRTIVIATIKSWNMENFKKLKKTVKGYNFVLIKNKEGLTYGRLKVLNPLFVFFPHWSWIIPQEIYDNFECVVFHMTDLPFGREEARFRTYCHEEFIPQKYLH